MKYSRTAIGLLTAQYRSVLKKCLLINLGLYALGAVAATPANATNVSNWSELKTALEAGTDATLTGNILLDSGTTQIAASSAGTYSLNLGNYKIDAQDTPLSFNLIQATNGNLNISGGEFTNFKRTTQYGSVLHLTSNGDIIIDGTDFKNNTSITAAVLTVGTAADSITVKNSKFDNNTAGQIGAVGLYKMGNFDNVEFTNNKSTTVDEYGDGIGALFLGSVSATGIGKIEGSLFENNTSAGRAGALGMRDFTQGNNADAKLDIKSTNFISNTAATNGGAIDNYFYNNAANEGYVKVTSSTFNSNSASNGGAVYNHIGHVGDKQKGSNTKQTAETDPSLIQTGNIYFEDSDFIGNTASELGGAAYNEGILTFVANTKNVAFSGNTANGKANDIYNLGTLNLNALAGKTISLEGGIDGDANNKGTTNIEGAGIVQIANALKNQNVNNIGNLVLDGANLDGTKIEGNGSVKVEGNSEVKGTTLTNQTLEVEAGKELKLTDVKLTETTDGEGTVTNLAGGTLNIKGTDNEKSVIGVKIDNYGRLISDPTTYTDTVNNYAGAYASFTNDTFTGSDAELANNGTVDFDTVTFSSGAKITGNGTTNLVSGTSVFNSTANSNTINLAGGTFTGTIANTGIVNAQNGVIDAITGVVTGGNLYVDASLGNTPSIDTFGSGTTGTIKKVNLLSSEYGTADSVELTGDFASDVTVDGFSYYTNVDKSQSGKIVFSDKLVNTSTIRGGGSAADPDGAVVLGDKAATTTIGTTASNIALTHSNGKVDITGATTVNGTLTAGATTVDSLKFGASGTPEINGVDTTPTAENTTKLITSAGVASALSTKQNTISAINKLDADFLKDGTTNKVSAWNTAATKASTAIQGVKLNASAAALTPDSDKVITLGLANIATSGNYSDLTVADGAIANSKLALNRGTANDVLYYGASGLTSGKIGTAQIADNAGILATQLASDVQVSLAKADNATRTISIQSGSTAGVSYDANKNATITYVDNDTTYTGTSGIKVNATGHTIGVDFGKGLYLDATDSNKLAINVGDGLKATVSDGVAVNTGAGLQFNSTSGAVEIATETGNNATLKIDDGGKLVVNKISDNNVDPDALSMSKINGLTGALDDKVANTRVQVATGETTADATIYSKGKADATFAKLAEANNFTAKQQFGTTSGTGFVANAEIDTNGSAKFASLKVGENNVLTVADKLTGDISANTTGQTGLVSGEQVKDYAVSDVKLSTGEGTANDGTITFTRNGTDEVVAIKGWDKKQDNLSAGQGINIADKTVSVKLKTFTPATDLRINGLALDNNGLSVDFASAYTPGTASNPATDETIAAWAGIDPNTGAIVGNNALKIANVATTFAVLKDKMTIFQNDLFAANTTKNSIAAQLVGYVDPASTAAATDTRDLVQAVGDVAQAKVASSANNFTAKQQFGTVSGTGFVANAEIDTDGSAKFASATVGGNAVLTTADKLDGAISADTTVSQTGLVSANQVKAYAQNADQVQAKANAAADKVVNVSGKTITFKNSDDTTEAQTYTASAIKNALDKKYNFSAIVTSTSGDTPEAKTADTPVYSAAKTNDLLADKANLAGGNTFTGDQIFNGAITANQSIAAKAGITVGAAGTYGITDAGVATLGATTVGSLKFAGDNVATSITAASTGETATALSLATAGYAVEQAKSAADNVVDVSGKTITFKKSDGSTEAQTYTASAIKNALDKKYNFDAIDTGTGETAAKNTPVYSALKTNELLTAKANLADGNKFTGLQEFGADNGSGFVANASINSATGAAEFASVKLSATNPVISSIATTIRAAGDEGADDSTLVTEQAVRTALNLKADDFAAGNGLSFAAATDTTPKTLNINKGAGLAFDADNNLTIAKEIVNTTTVTPITAPTAADTYYDAQTVYANFALKNNPGQDIVAHSVNTQSLKVAIPAAGAAEENVILEAKQDTTTGAAPKNVITLNGDTTLTGTLTMPAATGADPVTVKGIKTAVSADGNDNYLITSGAVNDEFNTKVGTLANGQGATRSVADVLGVSTATGTEGQLIFAEKAGVTNIASGDGSRTAPTTVVGAIENLSYALGMIHGLVTEDPDTLVKTFHGTTVASTNLDANRNYIGNLKAGTSVSDDLVSLDNALGAVSTLNTDVKDNIVAAVNDMNSKVVHKAGDELVTGVKTFENGLKVGKDNGEDPATNWTIKQVDNAIKAISFRIPNGDSDKAVLNIGQDSSMTLFKDGNALLSASNGNFALSKDGTNYLSASTEGLYVYQADGETPAFQVTRATGDVKTIGKVQAAGLQLASGPVATAVAAADADAFDEATDGTTLATMASVKNLAEKATYTPVEGGNIEATTIGGAIAELDTDKFAKADIIKAGDTTTAASDDKVYSSLYVKQAIHGDGDASTNDIVKIGDKAAITQLGNAKYNDEGAISSGSGIKIDPANKKIALGAGGISVAEFGKGADSKAYLNVFGNVQAKGLTFDGNIIATAIDDAADTDTPENQKTLATLASINGAIADLLKADNTWSGSNTYTKTIIAQKGIQIGDHYKIAENGAGQLTIRDVATDKAKVVYKEGSLGLYATDTEGKNSSYFSILNGSTDPNIVDGMRLSSDGKAYFKALANQMVVINPEDSAINFKVENATGNTTIKGDLTAGDETKAYLNVDNAEHSVTVTTKKGDNNISGFEADGDTAAMVATDGTNNYGVVADIEGTDKSVFVGVTKEGGENDDTLVAGMEADADGVGMGVGDENGKLVAGFSAEKKAADTDAGTPATNNIEMGAFDTTNKKLATGVSVDSAAETVSVVAGGNPIVTIDEDGIDVVGDIKATTLSAKDTITVGDFNNTDPTQAQGVQLSKTGTVVAKDVDGNTGTYSSNEIKLHNGTSDKDVFSVDANGTTTTTKLAFTGAPTVMADAIDNGSTAQTLDLSGETPVFRDGQQTTLATVATVLESAENGIFTANNPAAAALGGAKTINQAINNIASNVDNVNNTIGDWTKLKAQMENVEGTNFVTENEYPEKTPSLVSAAIDLDNAIGKRSAYKNTHYANATAVVIPVADAIANLDNKVFQDIHGQGTASDPKGTVRVGDMAKVTVIGSTEKRQYINVNTDTQSTLIGNTSFGAKIDSKGAVATIGGQGENSYKIQLNQQQQTTTIGTPTNNITMNKGDLTATGDITANGDITAKGALSAENGDFTVTNDGTKTTLALKGDENVKGNITVATADDAVMVAINNDGTVTAKQKVTAGVVGEGGALTSGVQIAADGSITSKTATDTLFTVDTNGNTTTKANLSADNGGFTVTHDADKDQTQVTVAGDVDTQSLTMADADQSGASATTPVVKSTVTAIDTAKAVQALTDEYAITDAQKATLATVGTVLNSAENAIYRPIDDLKGESKNYATAGSQTINGAIADIDKRIGDFAQLNKDAADQTKLSKNLTYNGTIPATGDESTVVDMFNSIDKTLGTIHGLATSLGDKYKGNLDEGNTSSVEKHLAAIDTAIGDRRDYTAQYNIKNNQSVAESLDAMDLRMGDVASLGREMHYYSDPNPANVNLSSAVKSLDSNLYRLEMDHKKLRHETHAGLASAAALSALVPNPRGTGDTTLSFGTGAYQGHTAAAFGGFHWITNNLLVNAGVGWDNREATTRIGVSYSF